MSSKIERTSEEWKALLAARDAEPLAYHTTRRAGTERAFTGRWLDNHQAGTYRCICCDKPLFDAAAKYNSGSGWPSFYQALAPDAVATSVDQSLGMTRVEVHCPDCGAHLGHVFEDGPAPTGLRYCMNSASLNFSPT